MQPSRVSAVVSRSLPCHRTQTETLTPTQAPERERTDEATTTGSHYAKKDAIAKAYVTGEAIVALCGRSGSDARPVSLPDLPDARSRRKPAGRSADRRAARQIAVAWRGWYSIISTPPGSTTDHGAEAPAPLALNSMPLAPARPPWRRGRRTSARVVTARPVHAELGGGNAAISQPSWASTGSQPKTSPAPRQQFGPTYSSACAPVTAIASLSRAPHRSSRLGLLDGAVLPTAA